MSDPASIATGHRDEELAAVGAAGAPAAVLRRFRRKPWLVLGLVGLLMILASATLAPFIAPHPPLRQDLASSLAPPVWAGGTAEHPLGTDALGRDIASRLLYGARNSLTIALGAVLVGSLLGLVSGLASGFFGRWVDAAIMGLGNVQLAFPFILLAIAILGLSPDRTRLHLILVLGIPAWIIYARVVRSRVLAERKKDYVLAARSVGASGPRVLIRYVLPSVWQVIPVIALLDLGFIVLVESTLSFLGFGLSPPTPSWGSILADGRKFMLVSPWLPILPGLAILITVLFINLAADTLAGMLDPRLTRATLRHRLLPWPGRRGQRLVERSEEAQALLRVQDLVVDFELPGAPVHAVRGVSFELQRGQSMGIVGESGSGKTVTALAIIRLLDPPGRITRGSISFDGRDLTALDERSMVRIRGDRVGMIFQNPTSSLTPVLTIGFQMTEALRQHREMSREEAERLARESLRSVGISSPDRILHQYPFQLSGGMNQRVMIAMTMALRPDLLIADEPTTALDVTTQAQILEQLRELQARLGTSILLITHDIAVVADFADVILVMYAGQVCEAGPVAAILEDPKHPYTRALLDSVPRIDLPHDSPLQAIGGDLPDATSVPGGCPFAPRCPYVMDVCRDVNPPVTRVAADRGVACHLWTTEEVEAAER
jgi:oligopeptide/dipeptide ABC transporter ATP-binding protein